MRRRPPERDASREELRERYRALQLKHTALLGRLADNVRADSAFHRLTWFALQSSSSALAMFREGRVVMANPRWRELASARAPSRCGWTWQGDDDQRHYADLGTMGATELERLPGGGEPITCRCRRDDGAQVLRVRLELVTRRGEQPVGLLLAEDVTGEIAHEEEVARLRETVTRRERMSALGRLAAGVAHDLGNTVNALSLRVGLVSRAVDAHGKSQLPEIVEAIGMLRQTLDRLDRFSGRRNAPQHAIDLRAVILAAVKLVGLELKAGPKRAPVTIKVDLPRRLPRVAGEGGDLTHVFVNLLLNARDAMPDGGTVTVEAHVTGPTVTVRVADEGGGFQPEHLARVFEPFFTTKGARGTGLGLSLAYGTMEALGGSIRADNRPGGGAEVTLHLPLAPSSVLVRDRQLGVARRPRRKRLQ
jgi:signal transduction histidine kinase